MFNRIYLIAVLFFCFGFSSIDQTQTYSFKFSNSTEFQLVNRDVNIINQPGKIIVHLDSKSGEGIAWINHTNFTRGAIEFDVKGKDAMQQSFVGIAFHEVDDSAYDGIYFRPFNFQSIDTVKRNHSLQYISMPKYDWHYLCETFPGKFENKLTKDIQPDQWFHAKIKVTKERIEVFVNNDGKPSLVVKPLSNDIPGKIGFWVGNNSEGYFSNLIIKSN